MIEKRFLSETEAVFQFELFTNFIIYVTESNKIKIIDLRNEKVVEVR